jgi:DNA polymerase I-like protein with 3'-5' exonuclease and polymerase domains
LLKRAGNLVKAASKTCDTIAVAQLTLKNDYDFRDLSDSGLKTLVPQLYGEELPKFSEVVGDKFFDELDPDDYETCRYACADSDYALRLKHTFEEWFADYLPNHSRIAREVESPAAVYAGLMKYNGVAVNKPLMDLKAKECEAVIEKLKSDIVFIIGDVDIGASAGTQAFSPYPRNGEHQLNSAQALKSVWALANVVCPQAVPFLVKLNQKIFEVGVVKNSRSVLNSVGTF